jgi:hypothetical protein
MNPTDHPIAELITMHIVLAKQIADQCRFRYAEGDCPITPLPSEENMMEAIITLDNELTSVLRSQAQMPSAGERAANTPGTAGR